MEERVIQATIDRLLVKECLMCSDFAIQLIADYSRIDSSWDF